MPVAREWVEGQIEYLTKNCGLSREEAIDYKLGAAEKGARDAAVEVMYAKFALEREKDPKKREELERTITREERLAALETNTILFLKEIAKEDKQKK